MFDPVLLAALSGTTFSPRSLFAGGEQGAWYDPSDFSTMFQDSAGTTPVTAVEQPVGLIRDKSGKGNHASQATSTSRPVLSARVNLLTYSEQFDNAAWTKASGAVVTADQGTDPLGGNTADKYAAGSAAQVQRQISGLQTGLNYTLSVWIKGVSTSATVGLYLSYGTTTPDNALVCNATTTWQRFSLTGTISNVSTATFVNIGTWGAAGTGPSADILIWGADLRVTNDGVGIPAYQRVNAATDYDTSGFPLYLAFDGVDDSLSTASVDFSATDKVSLFAGVRKLSDVTAGIVAELTAAGSTNAFALYSLGAVTGWGLNSGGTIQASASATGTAGPFTQVLSGLADISGDVANLRLNGVQAGQSLSNQGTGNYANDALYIGRRGGSSLSFNGRLYSLLVVGRATTSTEISKTETWVNQRTGAY